nr:MAG TPA: hypothetical protein [Caudoviricetes sp.]
MELVTSAYFFRVFIWERDIEATILQSMEVATEKPPSSPPRRRFPLQQEKSSNKNARCKGGICP